MRPYQTSKFRTRPARALLLAAAPALALAAMLPALGPVFAGPPDLSLLFIPYSLSARHLQNCLSRRSRVES